MKETQSKETTPAQDSNHPVHLFKAWFAEAQKTPLLEPTSVALATSTPEGRPSVRMVLLKGADEKGFVIYTNLTSRKGRELQENPQAALCFHWDPLRKQVRVTGRCERVSDQEADAYFASRHRTSQIGAWASKQSQELSGRFELESRIAHFGVVYGVGPIPRPPFWSGFRLVPDAIEFWEDRKFRLHDRFVFERDGDTWTKKQLFP